MLCLAMLRLLLSLLNIVKCDEYLQQLVFGTEHGKNGSVNHFCDFQIKPYVEINSITIFMKTGEGDQAVPKITLSPTISPSFSDYLRVQIPINSIYKKGLVFYFQFENKEDLRLYSKDWTYDHEKACLVLIQE